MIKQVKYTKATRQYVIQCLVNVFEPPIEFYLKMTDSELEVLYQFMKANIN